MLAIVTVYRMKNLQSDAVNAVRNASLGEAVHYRSLESFQPWPVIGVDEGLVCSDDNRLESLSTEINYDIHDRS